MHQVPPASSQPLSIFRDKIYQKTKALPTQVLDHCTVCIEEQLFSQAFSLLANSVTAGIEGDHEARVSPIAHLALAATLAVHPLLTTRTTSQDKHAAADDGLAYLKLVNHVTGPQNAGLDAAFVFGDADLSSRTGKRTSRPSGAGSGDEESEIGHIRSPFAKKDSLWTNAQDFWFLLGWAFNCSIAHPARWDRWKLWLDYMLEVLEDDLELRLPDAMRAYEAPGGNTAAIKEILKESMFARYLAPIGEGRNDRRRLMRAVLADGSKKSMAEFGEVWKGETKGPKKKRDEPVAKRRKLDLENGQFGDYFDDESERESPGGESMQRSRSTTAFSTTRRSRAPSANNNSDDSEDELHGPNTPTANTTTPSSAMDFFGGLPSLNLRKRILSLLSRYCAANPDAFLDSEDLFDLYTEFLRPLPLPIFTAFVLPSSPWLGPNSQASLNQMLLRPLLAGTAPAYNENDISQADFERYYAPYAASKIGAVENARVGVCVEGLMRLLWEANALRSGHGRLRRVVEKGIAERKAKSEFDGRRKVEMRAREEEEGLRVLEASAERMRMVLDLLEG